MSFHRFSLHFASLSIPNDHRVIHTSGRALIQSDDTRIVVHESRAASMDTNSDRSGLKSINHGSDGLRFTLPSGNVSDRNSVVNNFTITSIVSTGVRILCISHTTVILTEVPMVVLKTAIATVVTVVLAELGRCVVV